MRLSRFIAVSATAILAALTVCAPALAQLEPCDLTVTGVEFDFDRENPIEVYEREEAGLAFSGQFKAKFQGTCVGVPPEFRGCSFCASFYFQEKLTLGAPFYTVGLSEAHRKVETLTYECMAMAMPLELELEINAEDVFFANPYAYRLLAAVREDPCDLDSQGNPKGPPDKLEFEEFTFPHP
jgi:hypothetical protein